LPTRTTPQTHIFEYLQKTKDLTRHSKNLYSAAVRMFRPLFFLLALFSLTVFGNDPCVKALVSVVGPESFQAAQHKRDLREIEELKLGTYNTYNLLRSADGNYQKPVHKQEGLARPILKNDLDIIIVEEVNDLAEMREFARLRLNDLYEPLLADSNDQRGIKVGYFVKRDLPFRVELTTSKDVEAVDPVTGQNRKVFSRDLLGLRIWATKQDNNDEPLISFFGTHFKSKRDRNGDPESRILRGLQNEVSELIVRKEMETNPRSIVVVGGDFNGDVRHEAEFAPLKTILEDVFDNIRPEMSDADRITHSFHQNGRAAVYSQIDAFLMSPSGRPYLKDAFVHRYVDAEGNTKPLPTTWEERNANPSDHFPVIFKFDFRKLLEDRDVLSPGISLFHIRSLQAPGRPETDPLPLVA